MHYDIAIISDLHCKYENQINGIVSQSNLLFSNQPKNPKQHPVVALGKLLEREQISCDFLLCLGDISDKMCDQGIYSGWQYVEEIGCHLKAKEIISTIGNHDVDSHERFKEYPFNYFAKDLGDKFPVSDNECVKNFWGENFFIKEKGDYLFLVFNSVHDHYNKDKARQSNIGSELINKIENELKRYDKKKLHKIAMCHHHPYSFSNDSVFFKDKELLNGGNTFLNMLERRNFHLFVHGHKHIPRLEYSNTLPVFCSGSYSSLENLLGKGILNMFHLLHFNEEDYSKGEITTYAFTVGDGWKEIAEEKPFFPALTGFGYRNSEIDDFVKLIAKWYDDKKKINIPFGSLLEEFPEVKYMVPMEQDNLVRLLEENHHIVIYPSFFSHHRRVISKLLS